MISIDSKDGLKIPAYLAKPSQDPRFAVVVLQELFGINANIRAIADAYAARGIVAIAPDLFWRVQPGVELDPTDPKSIETALAIMGQLDYPKLIADAASAAAHVRNLHGVQSVGAVGYCFGGRIAYLLSMEEGAIDAAVAYYGTGIHDELDKADRVRCPVLMHVAGEDALCPSEAQSAMHARFDDSEYVRIVDYPGAGHAFARPGSHGYSPKDAEAANRATAEFFAAL